MNPGILAAIIAMFGWGISDFLGAQASKALGELRAVLGVQIGGFISLLIFSPWLWERKAWGLTDLLLISAEAAMFLAANLLFYKAFRLGMVSIISPVLGSYAVIPVLLGITLFKERIGLQGITGICFVFIGLLMTASDWREVSKLDRNALARGLREALGAMVLNGLIFTILAELTRRLGWFSPVFSIRIGCLVGMLLLFLIKSRPNTPRWTVSGKALIAGSFDSLAILAFSIGTRLAPLAIVAPVSAAFPLVTILLAVAIKRERPAPNQWFGTGAIIAGTVMLSLV